ncbi:MAG TPA: hypothetical protein VFR56_07975, partial [Actinomycetes bacterium]|nr:hypothetical protein [Actinomycetes bacterium]
SRAAADTWDRRAGSFTVALVVLGLAGFLLALAADRERSAAPARWMLRVGVLAAVFGGLVAVSAAVSSTVGAAGRPAGRQFAEKLAAGEVALLQGECDTALERLNAAIADDTDHGPAYLARAEARVCSPDDEWLFGVPLTPARVDGALRDLAAARDLGVTDPTSALDTGWLHLLHAVHSPDDRDASLAAARASTRAALDQMSDRQSGGAHYARFTLALADLLDGSGRATGDYERAVACLGPSDGCDGLQDEMLRQVYALLALADLELVDTSAASLDDYRALIVNGVDPEGSDPAAEAGPVPDLGTWTLDVFPQELQLLSDSAPPDQPVSVVWYYRARPTDTWSVVVDASLQTLVPSMQSTGRPIAVSRDLPAGEYRADILVGGRLAESVRDEPPRYEPEPGYDRVVVSELGFTATVPDGWQRDDHAYGVETTFAPPTSDGALVIRRAERLTPDGEITEWAASLLDTWVAAIVGDELGDVVPRTEPWGFGADHAVERDYPDAEAWAAMGFVPYVPDHPECGGTALMAMTSGADDETSSSIRDSIVAQSGLLGIPVVDGYAGSEGFALDVSNGWAPLDPGASAERTLLFRAHQCSIGARAEVEVSNAAGTSLDESADTLLGAAELELDGFDLAHRRTRRLQGGQAAVDLEYTFVADGTDVTRRQLLALDGSELYVL